MNKLNHIQNRPKLFHDWPVYLIIVIAGAVIYGRSIYFEFTFFDDTRLLIENQAFIGNIANIPKLFTTEVFISMPNSQTFYRPLFNLLFLLEAQVAKENILLYHITNILLHIGCSLLVYKLLIKFQLSKNVSAAAAILFCVHPLNTSAVVWIPGRNDTLLTFFILGSFLFFLRAHETKRISPYVFHLLLFFFALLVKESAVVFPILCIGYVFLIGKEKPRRIEFLSVLASYIVVISIWVVMRSMVFRSFEIHQAKSTLILNWFGNLSAFLLYIGKIFFPINLSVFPNVADHSLIPGIIGVFIFAELLFIRRTAEFKKIFWGIMWFFLFLSPSMVFGPVFYEHRAYCAFAGFLIAAAYLPAVKNLDLSKIVTISCVISILLGFSILSFFHAEHFRNRLSFASDAISTAQSIDLSYSCMASMYLDNGDDASAEAVILSGIRRNPRMGLVHRMLGDINARRHEYALAEQEYEQSLQIEPLNLFTYANYGQM